MDPRVDRIYRKLFLLEEYCPLWEILKTYLGCAVRTVANGNSKWREIKSKLHDAHSRRDLNEKLKRNLNTKPKECKSNFFKWNKLKESVVEIEDRQRRDSTYI